MATNNFNRATPNIGMATNYVETSTGPVINMTSKDTTSGFDIQMKYLADEVNQLLTITEQLAMRMERFCHSPMEFSSKVAAITPSLECISPAAALIAANVRDLNGINMRLEQLLNNLDI